MACFFRSLVLLFSYSSWLPGLAGVPSPTETATPTYGNRPQTVASTIKVPAPVAFAAVSGSVATPEREEKAKKEVQLNFLTEAIALYSASSEEKTLCLRVYFFMIL